jgi:hypothetical protein
MTTEKIAAAKVRCSGPTTGSRKAESTMPPRTATSACNSAIAIEMVQKSRRDARPLKENGSTRNAPQQFSLKWHG